MRANKFIVQVLHTFVAGAQQAPAPTTPGTFQVVMPYHVEAIRKQREAAYHSWQLAGSPAVDETTVQSAIDRASQVEDTSTCDAKWEHILCELEISALELLGTIRRLNFVRWTNPVLSGAIAILILTIVIASAITVLVGNAWHFGFPFLSVVALDLAVLVTLLIVPANESLRATLEIRRNDRKMTLEIAANARTDLASAIAARDKLLTDYSLYNSIVTLDAQLEWLSKRLLDRRNELLAVNWRSLRGIPFEEFLTEILIVNGYACETTRKSGDQGVDIIASKSQRRIAIQAKGYEGTVGNGAIQEVVAGRLFYNCTECVVITNSYFTPAAKQLAQRQGNRTLAAGKSRVNPVQHSLIPSRPKPFASDVLLDGGVAL